MANQQRPSILERILSDARRELADARAARPPREIRARLADAPPVRPLDAALRRVGFSLIAEIKARSPSVGPMRAGNVLEAPEAYAECPLVRAVSVLTNQTHFGGSIGDLEKFRARTAKPVLRKDFLLDEYQVREARAFGADAVLLIAGILDASALRGFHDLALELGMQALFEVHCEDEIRLLPRDAVLVGVNSRKFRSGTGFVGIEGKVTPEDLTVDLDVFSLVDRLPAGAIRVAESGLDARNIALVAGRFDAALVGTSLLRDPRGVRPLLEDFASALSSLPTPP